MNATHGRPFVFVHGAGHGGWVWKRVRKILTAKGHEVFTPTLTGLGDRSHLLSPSITLDTHIRDVVNLFKWEDIRDAILVGHSYAGWVITGAAKQLEDRLGAIVYLDAFLPDDGERGYDFLNPEQRTVHEAAMARGDITRPGPTSAMLKVQSPADADWVDSKITPHPLALSMQRLRLTGARDRIAKKLYIRAPLFPQPVYDKALAHCRVTQGWQTVVMEHCGHDPMVDQPVALCEHLEGLL